jgi:hypothetical protein
MSDLKVNSLEAAAGGFIISRSVIKCNTPPSDNNDLTNKTYVDSALSVVSSGAVNTGYVDTRDQFYYDQVSQNFVNKTNSISEIITGVKTFQDSPLCSVQPSTASSLTNKQYVDQEIGLGVNQSKAYVDAQLEATLLSTADAIKKIVLPNQSVVYTDPDTGQTYTGPAEVLGDGSTPIAMIGKSGISITGGTAIVAFTKPGGVLVESEVNTITIDNRTSWIVFNGVGGLISRSGSNMEVSRTSNGTYTITHSAVGGTSAGILTSFSGRVSGSIVTTPQILARNTGITGVQIITRSGTVATDFDDLITVQIMG